MLPPKFIPSDYPERPSLVDHARSLMWHYRIPASTISYGLTKGKGTRREHRRLLRALHTRLCYLLSLPTPSGYIYPDREVSAFLAMPLTTYRAAVRQARRLHFKSSLKVLPSSRTSYCLTQRELMESLPL